MQRREYIDFHCAITFISLLHTFSPFTENRKKDLLDVFKNLYAYCLVVLFEVETRFIRKEVRNVAKKKFNNNTRIENLLTFKSEGYVTNYVKIWFKWLYVSC